MAEERELGRGKIPIRMEDAEFKKKLQGLKVEAKSLETIIRGVDKVANTMGKLIVAPIMTMATLGIKKFMATTDAGAYALKKQLYGLTWAWDQMLARIGAAIYKHGELGKLIEKIKHVLESIDERTIMRIFTVGKWALLLTTVMKIGTAIASWLPTIEKIIVATGKLAANKGGLFGAGPGGQTAAGSIMAQLLGASAGAAGGAAYANKGSKTLTSLEEQLKKLQKQYVAETFLPSGKRRTGNIISDTSQIDALKKEIQALTGVTGAGAATWLSSVKGFLAKVGSVAKIFAVVSGAIAIVVGILSGLYSSITGKEAKLFSLMEVLGGIFTTIATVFEMIFKGLMSLGVYLSRNVVNILKGGIFTKAGRQFFGETLDMIRKSLLDAFSGTVGKFLYELFNPTEAKQVEDAKKSKEPEQFSFGHKFMGSYGFAELNKVFQEMALQGEVMAIQKESNKLLGQIAANTAKGPSDQGAAGRDTMTPPSVFTPQYALA